FSYWRFHSCHEVWVSASSLSKSNWLSIALTEASSQAMRASAPASETSSSLSLSCLLPWKLSISGEKVIHSAYWSSNQAFRRRDSACTCSALVTLPASGADEEPGEQAASTVARAKARALWETSERMKDSLQMVRLKVGVCYTNGHAAGGM